MQQSRRYCALTVSWVDLKTLTAVGAPQFVIVKW